MTKIKQITIIGLGLMGGSFALALKNKGFDYKITGFELSTDCLEEALAIKAIDIAAKTLKEAVMDADLIVIAVPINSYEDIFKEISGFLKPNSIVTDLGSVKVQPLEIAKKLLPKETLFIGGHPMTGSERGGLKAANPFLYENAYYFLTPEQNTPQAAIKVLEALISSIGAYPVQLSPEEHDLIVSRISHLPHIVAMTLVNFMDQHKGISYLPFVGGGFRDTTRIASGNPKMWQNILFANKHQVIENIDAFQLLLNEFKSHLEHNEPDKVEQCLENAKLVRDSIPHRGRDYIAQRFEIVVSVEDRPGTIAELTQLISSHEINIKEIEILHSRQNEGGAVRLAFESQQDQGLVIKLLQKAGFAHLYYKDQIQH